MREIKFRAWNELANKMYSHEDLEDVLVNLTKNDFIEGIFLPLNSDNELMQYTGLKDSNGNEIYEGDIVEKEFVDFSNRDKFIGIIKFIDGCWCVENENKKRAYFLFNETNINFVIGNIYENPELLNKI